jgi:hypothetical protein
MGRRAEVRRPCSVFLGSEAACRFKPRWLTMPGEQPTRSSDDAENQGKGRLSAFLQIAHVSLTPPLLGTQAGHPDFSLPLLDGG